MKCTTASALSAALLAGSVAAFPHLNMENTAAPMVEARASIDDLTKRQAAPPQGAGAMPNVPPPFNATQQLVSTSGKYAFVAPTSTDARGMCPGLNAMANHGYLPHNGVATIQQFIDATFTVFGMSNDLASFLAYYGAWVDGPGTGWSIEGAPHTGIGGSHGNYETDSSPFKGDLYQYGSNGKLIIEQFKTLFDMQPNAATANYNLEVLRDFRGSRFQESIAKNPYYAYQPFAGQLVSQAAFTFMYRFMANHTAEAPEGILNQQVLMSFNSVSGPESNFTWTPGYERIPDNWYKRNNNDTYSLSYFENDIVYFANKYPQIIGIGCNQGVVNSYNTISPADFSNGAFTAQQVAKNPLCFSMGAAIAELPLLTGLGATALAPVISGLTSSMSALNCQQAIGSVNQSVFTPCPGASLYDGPYAKVAPGAIQNQ